MPTVVNVAAVNLTILQLEAPINVSGGGRGGGGEGQVVSSGKLAGMKMVSFMVGFAVRYP